MQNDVIIAGFGGQGVMLIGKMLAYAAMNQGREVSWLPSYGPEMRGGTSNCTVVIDDHAVASPVIQSPQVLLAMNLPSLDKFEPRVRPGGLIIVNSSLIFRDVARGDLRVLKVAANDVANELGNPKGANMVALGAYVGATKAVAVAEMEALIKKTFAAKPQLIDKNIASFHRGYALGEAGVGEEHP